MVDGSKTHEPLLVARGVTRMFGNAYALRDATIALHRHEICGLLGANGAGKSTLSRIICGHLPPTSGEILFRGAPLTIGSARDALRSGIALVAQETSLAPDMSVLENIFLPSYAMPGRLSYTQLRQKAREIINQRYGNQDCEAYGDFRELLARDDIDAVVISTPDHWHVLLSLLSARAG